MENKKKELLERVLLLMKYNNEMTLTENTQIVSEQTSKPKSPAEIENEKALEASQGIIRKGLAADDYKTGNDYCNRGTVKDLQWEPNNLDGNETYKGKKGYCRLSDSKQRNLAQSLGTGYGGEWNIPTFIVKTQDEWYAVFAVWLAEMVEVWKFTNLYLNKSGYEGGCEKNKLSVNYNGKEMSLQDLISRYLPDIKSGKLTKAINEQSTEPRFDGTELQKRAIACGWKKSTVNGVIADTYGYEKSGWECPKTGDIKTNTGNAPQKHIYKFLCYNQDLAVYKPFYKINYGKLTSSAGRLSRTSINRYTGYIPSYAEVIKAYGFGGNVKNIITALSAAKKDDFFIGATNVKDGKAVGSVSTANAGDVHDVLSLLQIVSLMIPVVGPFVSLGLGIVDSGVYYAQGEKNMAALTLGLSILFDLPILKAGFGNIGKQAISNLTDEEIVQMSKALLENNTKNLPENLDVILKELETEMGKNPAVRQQYEQVVKEKSKEILGNKQIVNNLSPNSKSALNQAAKGQLAGKVFAAGTIGAGLPLTAKGGYETFKPLIRGNIKTQVEAEGYKWETVKQLFGSNGSAEDNKKLSEAWGFRWRPGLEVPEEYQTETYKQNKKNEIEKLAQELSKNLGLDNSEKMAPLDVKTIKPMVSSLTNPKIIATRDSLEKTYGDYEQYLGSDE